MTPTTSPTSTSVPPPDAPAAFDVIVLGAGISGLVGTSVLLDQGAGSILVIDGYAHAGGNHLDVALGDYTFDVGSFIFQDDSPLLRHFPELLDHYVAIEPTWSRLNPQGLVTEYPFSLRDDILAAGPVEIARIAVSAGLARLNRNPLRNARDFARHWVGPRFLYRSGLENYMARFCGCPTERIDLAFATSRMMWISDQAKLASIGRRLTGMLRRRPAASSTNRQLARPRAGFAAMYDPLVVGLEARGARFALGIHTTAVRRSPDGFAVTTDRGTFHAARVVSTVPITMAAGWCGLGVEPLPSVTLVSLFYSFSGRRGFDSSILYNFSHDARWKRLTVYSDFYGPVEGRGYFAVEVVADEAGTTPDQAAEEFRAHTAANGLLDGDLRLEGSHVLEQAYPIYTSGSAERASGAIAALRDFGVESFGRQGGFQYQPTARVSTLEAEGSLGVVGEHLYQPPTTGPIDVPVPLSELEPADSGAPEPAVRGHS